MHISKWLLNGKTSHHEADTFNHINGLFYKHAMDATPKNGTSHPHIMIFTILIKAHDKLGH